MGGHLLHEILKTTDCEIVALRRKDSAMDLAPIDTRIRWIEAELNDVDILLHEIQKCEILVHAAGMLSVHDSDAQALHQANATGTHHMINLGLEAEIDRFVHVSTVASLGREKDGLVNEKDIFEIHPLTSAYAISKYQADQEAYRGMAEGLSINIIRPSLIMGSGHWAGGSDDIIRKVSRGIPYYPQGGTGMVDVRDAAAMIRMMAFSKQDKLDVICNGHNLTFQCLQSEIAHQLGIDPPKKSLPKWMEGVIWRVEKLRSWFSGKPTILSKSSITRANQKYFYSNLRSKEVFDFEYRPWQDTIRETIKNFEHFRQTGEKLLLPL